MFRRFFVGLWSKDVVGSMSFNWERTCNKNCLAVAMRALNLFIHFHSNLLPRIYTQLTHANTAPLTYVEFIERFPLFEKKQASIYYVINVFYFIFLSIKSSQSHGSRSSKRILFFFTLFHFINVLPFSIQDFNSLPLSLSQFAIYSWLSPWAGYF